MPNPVEDKGSIKRYFNHAGRTRVMWGCSSSTGMPGVVSSEPSHNLNVSSSSELS